MKNIVVFGAGKSSISLIDYLLALLEANDWRLTIIDADLQAAKSRAGNSSLASGIAIDVQHEAQRQPCIQSADIVISLLPPALHHLVAADCLRFEKNLLTASYVDDTMRSLSEQVKSKGLLFLCEMGLDPGIDHMSAMQLFHRLQAQGHKVTSFRSHCGGLVAPESDDNPWRYKVSWNPRNIVLAGKAGAVFLEKGAERHVEYDNLFDAHRVVDVPGLGQLAWYANRDSLSYIDGYGMQEAATFIRTTLRYPEFCFGWKNIIDLKLTDQQPVYDTDGMTVKNFFQRHLALHGFSEWIENQLTAKLEQTRLLLEKLQQLIDAQEQVSASHMDELREFMMVTGNGELLDINLEEIKTKAAATVASQMHEANLAVKQLVFLGLDDDLTVINRGKCSAADVLQLLLEKKLALQPHDRDMIVMMHEFEWKAATKRKGITSTLIVTGEDHVHTAMAKTVGLPLGIAARLILQQKITLTGLHIPIVPAIYEPVLEELSQLGIRFVERESN